MRFLKYTLGAVLVFGVASVLPVSNIYAQGYSGLTAGGSSSSPGSSDQKSGVSKPGYGGLTAPRVTPSQPVITPQQKRQNTYYGQTPVQNPKNTAAVNPKEPQMSMPSGMPNWGALPVENGETLKLVALVEGIAKNRNRQGPINVKPINQKTLNAVNAPKEKVNGFWPEEARAITMSNMLMKDIQLSKGDAKKEKKEKAIKQLEALIDVNQARIATPDDVALRMGVTQQALNEKKLEAKAAIAQYEKAIKLIK